MVKNNNKSKKEKGKRKSRAPPGTSSRKLAAIMFTDMVGYTALGQTNEALSIALVNEQRRLLRPIFKRHNGREIKTIGDSFLLEFQSALDATRCAYDIQRAVREYNVSLPEDKRFMLRVGVHLGDVVETKTGDITGDAVNVASRIEPLAEHGGACITRQVYDHVQNKFELRFESLGTKSLKNVKFPIEIFKIVMPWEEDSGSHTSSKTTRTAPGLIREKDRYRASPFFGRQNELSFLSKQLDSAVEGHGSLVLVGGGAGVGKSSLVQQFLSRYDGESVTILSGYCLAEVSVSYFPFIEALGSLLKGRNDKQSDGIFNILSGFGTDPGNSAQSPYQIFEHIVTKLTQGSLRKPMILFLEDLQWADSASLSLLHYLARNLKDKRVLILITYRTEELLDRGQGKPHPFLETMRLMNREGLYSKLELSGLGTENINEVTRSIISEASNQVLELVAKESEGNPFYAVESSRYLLDSGALELSYGAYVMKKSMTKFQVPASILDVIARRLSRLTYDERQLIDCASVIGEHFDAKIVARALEQDEFRTIQSLVNLARTTRMIFEEQDSFRFEHAKIKETVYGELGPALTKSMHTRVANAIFSTNGPKNVQELAYHYHAAGAWDKTVEFGISAGDQAKAQFAYSESVTYYGWALEAADQIKENLEVKAATLAKRAESLLEEGLHQRAIEDSERALTISKNNTVRFFALRVSATSWRKMGHFTEALDAIKKAEGEHGREKLEYLRLQEEKALILNRKNDPSASEVWKELGRGYLELGGKREYARAIFALDESPNTKDPVQVRYEVLKIYEELGDLSALAETHFDLADYITLHSGDVLEAEQNYRKGIKLANKIGNHDLVVWAYLYWGILLEAAGRYGEALAMCQSGIEAARLAESPYPETGVYSLLVRCCLRSNRTDEAENALDKMNALYDKHSKDSSQGMRSFVARSRGFRLAYLGRWKESDEAYTTSINLLEGSWGAHDPNTRREYAEWLIKQDRGKEALEQLELALRNYQTLQHKHGMEICQEMIREVSRV